MEIKKTVSTKEKIIDVSIDLFSSSGYADTSIRQIAKKVGIQASSIYNHFSSKEQILMAIFKMYNDVVIDHMYKSESNPLNKTEITVNNIMNRLFFAFPEDSGDTYIKILKIIFTEHRQSEVIRNYLKDILVDHSYELITSELNKVNMVSEKESFDVSLISGVLLSILLSFSMLTTLDINYIGKDDKKIDMFSLLELVLQKTLDGMFN